MSEEQLAGPPQTVGGGPDQLKLVETSIPVLKRNNWNIWKFKMELHLKAKGVFSAMEAEVQNGQLNQAALSIIVNACDEENVTLLMQCNTAYRAWQRLLQAHENKTPQDKHVLWQSMFNLKIGNVTEVQLRVAELQNTAAQLKLLHENVTETCLMALIMAALPAVYGPFLESIATQDDQSLDRFRKLLDNHTRKLMLDAKPSDNVALAGVKNQSKFKRHQRKGRRDRSESTGATDTKPEKFDGECNICKKYGHKARDCYQNKKRYPNGPPKRGRASPEPVSFMTLVGGPKSTEDWILDSGSSLHITPNRQWLRDYCELQPSIAVKLGNDSVVQALGKGWIKTTAGIIEEVYFVPDFTMNLFAANQVTKKGFVIIQRL